MNKVKDHLSFETSDGYLCHTLYAECFKYSSPAWSGSALSEPFDVPVSSGNRRTGHCLSAEEGRDETNSQRDGGKMKNKKDNLGANTASRSLTTCASGAWYNTDCDQRND